MMDMKHLMTLILMAGLVGTTSAQNTTTGTAGLKFSLNQTFTSDLSNTSSPVFKNLTDSVVTEVNRAFNKTKGFLHSNVNSFKNGSVIVDTTLVFANTSVVPDSAIIVSTFTNSNTTLNLVPGSATASSYGGLDVQFSLNQTTFMSFLQMQNIPGGLPSTFTSDLSNQSSTVYQTVSGILKTQVNRVFTNTTGFRHSNVNSFKNGSVIVDTTLVFVNKSVVPDTTTILSTFTNSNTTLNIVPGSTTASSYGGLDVQFSLNQTTFMSFLQMQNIPGGLPSTFTSDLSNQSSTVYQTVSGILKTQVNSSFSSNLSDFLGTIINSLRNPSNITDLTLVFVNQTSVPNAFTVQNLINNSTFSSFIEQNTLRVSQSTVNPYFNPTPSTTSTPATTTTTSTTTASTNPPSATEGVASLQFSLKQDFTSDLSDTSSSGFKTLAGKVVSEVNRVFSETKGFLRSIVKKFQSGSVIVDMTLVFANKSVVPDSATILSTFTNSNTTLNIVPGSTTANSGADRPTVFSMAALPVTVALLMIQMLTG
ncbi:hypothetical protein DPEC_G00180430 [Dallia pectoralis]|uniref:Uncharacterized protein n=1 Tax=Dallia pectoralis TaxID=75939 RepID=A0ACC2GA20_DALPE|nr:hypothetical protein DPEC_G00180430 [Dallia pectoralis]